jgi:hypothetical protein
MQSRVGHTPHTPSVAFASTRSSVSYPADLQKVQAADLISRVTIQSQKILLRSAITNNP